LTLRTLGRQQRASAGVTYAQEGSMPRNILDEAQIHPAIRERVAKLQVELVYEVQAAIRQHEVLVLGMAQNPYPRKARQALDAAGVPYHYLAYGSYFSDWRRRSALKMWTGWPTFPMVFVKGTLVGGADDLARLIASGELQRMLA
jgi:monothiol glutaredoxin